MSTSSLESSVEKKPAGRASSRRTKRWIAVAAAIIVVAGGATAIASSKGGDSQRSGTVVTDAGAVAARTTIAVGGSSSCAMTTTNPAGAKCWGSNFYGQAGNGATGGDLTSAVNVQGMLRVSAIAAGESHTCALGDSLNQVFCWGLNSSGQVGNNTFVNQASPQHMLLQSSGNFLIAKAITAGSAHTCALAGTDLAYCWGNNGSGRLGNGLITNSSTGVPVKDPGNSTQALPRVRAISAGGTQTCAISGDAGAAGQVYCWGTGYAATGANTGITAKSVSVGNSHTCVVLTDSSVKCWGDNTYGQLGNGTKISTPYSAPVAATGISNAVDVVTGKYHTCALLSDQTVKCWGDYSNGQTGQTPGENQYQQRVGSQTTPTSLAGITAVTAISSSSSSLHTCAIGNVSNAVGMKCWGGNASYQINYSLTPYLTTPWSEVY